MERARYVFSNHTAFARWITVPEYLVCGLDPGVKTGGKEGEEAWILVDSGAGLHCCPLGHGEHFPLTKSQFVKARTATGQPVTHYGKRVVRYDFGGGATGDVTYGVMDVTLAPTPSGARMDRYQISHLAVIGVGGRGGGGDGGVGFLHDYEFTRPAAII